MLNGNACQTSRAYAAISRPLAPSAGQQLERHFVTGAVSAPSPFSTLKVNKTGPKNTASLSGKGPLDPGVSLPQWHWFLISLPSALSGAGAGALTTRDRKRACSMNWPGSPPAPASSLQTVANNRCEPAPRAINDTIQIYHLGIL